MKSDCRHTALLDFTVTKEQLEARVRPTDELGCDLFNLTGSESRRRFHSCQVQAVVVETGETVLVSAHRAAYVIATGDHVREDEDVAHSCGCTGADGKPYCISPDHLFKETAADLKRRQQRTRHVSRMRKTVPSYMGGGAQA